MKKEVQQWNMLEKAKTKLVDWSKSISVHLFAVHFVPMLDFSLEVYIFYENDKDISTNESNGISDRIKETFLNALDELSYYKCFDNSITFVFDSNENVMKNYQGSYFLRLR